MLIRIGISPTQERYLRQKRCAEDEDGPDAAAPAHPFTEPEVGEGRCEDWFEHEDDRCLRGWDGSLSRSRV